VEWELDLLLDSRNTLQRIAHLLQIARSFLHFVSPTYRPALDLLVAAVAAGKRGYTCEPLLVGRMWELA
jgi:hypothetical protein